MICYKIARLNRSCVSLADNEGESGPTGRRQKGKKKQTHLPAQQRKTHAGLSAQPQGDRNDKSLEPSRFPTAEGSHKSEVPYTSVFSPAIRLLQYQPLTATRSKVRAIQKKRGRLQRDFLCVARVFLKDASLRRRVASKEKQHMPMGLQSIAYIYHTHERGCSVNQNLYQTEKHTGSCLRRSGNYE